MKADAIISWFMPTEGLLQFSEILSGMAQEIDRLTALVWDLGNAPWSGRPS